MIPPVLLSHMETPTSSILVLQVAPSQTNTLVVSISSLHNFFDKYIIVHIFQRAISEPCLPTPIPLVPHKLVLPTSLLEIVLLMVVLM